MLCIWTYFSHKSINLFAVTLAEENPDLASSNIEVSLIFVNRDANPLEVAG